MNAKRVFQPINIRQFIQINIRRLHDFFHFLPEKCGFVENTNVYFTLISKVFYSKAVTTLFYPQGTKCHTHLNKTIKQMYANQCATHNLN